MVEAFIFQETKSLYMPFNSQQWEAEVFPLDKASLSKSQVVREANPQFYIFNSTYIIKKFCFQ
jgi:hypothetical protein